VQNGGGEGVAITIYQLILHLFVKKARKMKMHQANPSAVTYSHQLFATCSPRNSAKIECNHNFGYRQLLHLFMKRSKKMQMHQDLPLNRYFQS